MNLEKGIFFTLKEFAFYPGRAAENYLFGDRKRFMDPIKLLILTTSIATFITLSFVDMTEGMKAAFYYSESANSVPKEFIEEVGILFQKYYNLLYLSMVPCIAFFAWAIYKSKGWYFAEHLAIAMYISSVVNGISILSIPFLLYDFSIGTTIILAFQFPYLWFCYHKIFKEDWQISFGKSTLILFLGLFVSSMFSWFLAGCYIGYRMAAEGAL